MIWSAKLDCFSYKINPKFENRVTKRVVLSETSQIFDPLGILSPVIIIAKIILRDIWLEKIDWDTSLPLNLHTRWLQFRDELCSLNTLEIPRHSICPDPIHIEIHAFSNASTQAYGSCIYPKSVKRHNETFIRLICSKSKVCPVKIQTIPRLELLAAVLTCKLAKKVLVALKTNIDRVVYRTDSSIVLGWINTSPNLLQVFVANRISVIQEMSESKDWFHVPTKDNPADFVSRGISPRYLQSTDLYWNGPLWLHQEEKNWPSSVEYKE